MVGWRERRGEISSSELKEGRREGEGGRNRDWKGEIGEERIGCE